MNLAARFLLVGGVAAAGLVGAVGRAGPASAHQDGCHRWHSCPSDSGSYACGDAGYECRYPTYPESDRGLVPDPMYTPPAYDPSPYDPSAYPSAYGSPAYDPPAYDPPAYDPSAYPSTDDPPATDPPTTYRTTTSWVRFTTTAVPVPAVAFQPTSDSSASDSSSGGWLMAGGAMLLVVVVYKAVNKSSREPEDF